MPKLEFMESLTQEQDKLVIMGTIKHSKDQDLVARDSRVDSKRKKKYKKPPEQKRDKNKSQEDPQGSKKKKNKGEMRKCAYYSKGYHLESSCMKKHIDMLTQLLEKNNISLTDCSKKREGGSNSEDRERVHALVTSTSI